MAPEEIPHLLVVVLVPLPYGWILQMALHRQRSIQVPSDPEALPGLGFEISYSLLLL
jgi:hypothetical protein